jgi:hypothetical protein
VTHLDNPAGRLEAVLVRAEPLVVQDLAATDGWMRAFDVAESRQLPGQIAEFVVQVEHARTLIDALPVEEENPEHLLRYFPYLDRICENMLILGNVRMAHFATWVKPELIYSVGACSSAIRRNGGREPTLDADGIEEILELIIKIRGEIVDSAIPQVVKTFILRRLHDVEDAVVAFRIAGYSGVESTLDALVGAAIWRTPPTSQEPVKGWLHRLWETIQRVTQGTAAIAGSAQKVAESYKAITGE